MSKPWDQKPLWQLIYMSDDSEYRDAARLIGYGGVEAGDFWRQAATLPGFRKHRFEAALDRLCPHGCRTKDATRYEMTDAAKGCCRVLLGPPPGDPELQRWREARAVSLREMGQAVPAEWGIAEEKPKLIATAKRKRKKTP